MTEFIITCHTGFEEYTEEEARELGCFVKERREGRVIVEGSLDRMYALNRYARTAHKVILLLDRARARNLDEIYSRVKATDFSFINPEQRFAVRSERSGLHDFTSIDIARVAGQAIIDSYMQERGVRLGVNLDEPDVVITVDLIGEELFIGVDTTGESLHIREYRRYNHPSALKPSLASALLRMAEWNGGSLLDPFTGGATIPIEAALRAKGMPVHEKKHYLYRNLSFYSEEEEAVVSGASSFSCSKIVGVEKVFKHYRGAVKNMKEAGVSDLVEVLYEDVIQYRPDEPFEFIVSNPPYGIRSGRRDKVQILYRLFADRLPRLLKRGGIGVLISTEHKPLKEILEERGYRIIKEDSGRHGKLWVKALKFTG